MFLELLLMATINLRFFQKCAQKCDQRLPLALLLCFFGRLSSACEWRLLVPKSGQEWTADSRLTATRLQSRDRRSLGAARRFIVAAIQLAAAAAKLPESVDAGSLLECLLRFRERVS